MVRRHTTSFKPGFPRFLSLIFERIVINLTGITQVAIRPSEELTVSSFCGIGIATEHIVPPIREHDRKHVILKRKLDTPIGNDFLVALMT